MSPTADRITASAPAKSRDHGDQSDHALRGQGATREHPERRRQPSLDPDVDRQGIEARKSLLRDPDDREQLVIHEKNFTDGGCYIAVAPLGETMAHHGHGLSAASFGEE